MGVDVNDAKKAIEEGKTYLGIEFGSTRIKAVLIDENHEPIASGGYGWENQYVNKIWTYDMADVWKGLAECYADLVRDVQEKYHTTIETFGAIGISAMMHGYLPFDKEDNLLVPFRTWRNTITEQAAAKLTDLFRYNIPQRWSIAHLYQAILNGEEHLPKVDYITTLSGYVHWKLTGQKVLGIDDASGMFPIDPETKDFHSGMLALFDELVSEKNFSWKIKDILPKVLTAGAAAGVLTDEGAKLLDVSGHLKAGIPLCPPEGDGGTGMTATNSVAVGTGNVSAGTSIFAMLVTGKELSKVYTEIDMVTTPAGDLVAMAHANNCTSDLNAWVNIFKEFSESFGLEVDMSKLFSTLYNKALEGETDCGGLLSYGYLSGENMLELDEGRPLLMRLPDARFNLANFMRANLYAALGALKVGMDILMKDEGVKVDQIQGHGGLFKTKGVGQRMMAACMNAPVTVMETAGEGGAWGIALLAAYMERKSEGETLAEYLNEKVFSGQQGSTMDPVAEDVDGFEKYMVRFKSGLNVERAAVEYMN